ncbi:MAG: hypothetical protein ACLQPH_13600 [Acidimicrobiales bacterium]
MVKVTGTPAETGSGLAMTLTVSASVAVEGGEEVVVVGREVVVDVPEVPW